MAAHVLVSDRDEVLALFDRLVGHPVRSNLLERAAPVGEARGFEVVGFEAGRTHSWLCYGLHEDATPADGDRGRTQFGLLSTFERARAAAQKANARRGTMDGTPLEVTWFPVLVTECPLDLPNGVPPK